MEKNDPGPPTAHLDETFSYNYTCVYACTSSQPRGLSYAWTEIVSRMTKMRVQKSKSAALR